MPKPPESHDEHDDGLTPEQREEAGERQASGLDLDGVWLETDSGDFAPLREHAYDQQTADDED